MALSDDQLLEMFSDIKQSLGRIEGSFSATVESQKQRIDELHDTIETNDRRQWIVSACVIPIVTALHYLANKIGLRV